MKQIYPQIEYFKGGKITNYGIKIKRIPNVIVKIIKDDEWDVIRVEAINDNVLKHL